MGKGTASVLQPARAADTALEFIREDEAVEVTPDAIRLRKAELDQTARGKLARIRKQPAL
jgi:GTP-binding protein